MSLLWGLQRLPQQEEIDRAEVLAAALAEMSRHVPNPGT
jgi:hypothetical protein